MIAFDWETVKGVLTCQWAGVPLNGEWPVATQLFEKVCRNWPFGAASYGLMRILPGDHSPLWTAVPRSSSAVVASTTVVN